MSSGNKIIGDRATISDVAAAAGVSLGTASRVINGKSSEIRISEATKLRVLEAAARLNYRKNLFASGLRGQKSEVLGMIIRDLHDPFLLALVDAVQAAAHARNMGVLMGHADYSSQTADTQIRFMLDHWFDGLLLLGNLPDDASLRAGLTQSGVPCVAIACNDDHLLNSVGVNDAEGAVMALDHLIQAGHSRIAFVGDTALAGVAHRLDVYRRYRDEGSLHSEEGWVVTIPNRREVETVKFEPLVSRKSGPTAIFCASDFMAMRVIGVAQEAGLHIPEDLSIIGFDDVPDSAAMRPPLTTIRQPLRQMADSALDLLLERPVANGMVTKIFAPELVARASVATIRGAVKRSKARSGKPT